MPIHINQIVEKLEKVKSGIGDIITTLQTDVIFGDISRPKGVKMRRRRKPGPKPGTKRTTIFPEKKSLSILPKKETPKSPQLKNPKSALKKLATKPAPKKKETIKPAFTGPGAQGNLPGVE